MAWLFLPTERPLSRRHLEHCHLEHSDIYSSARRMITRDHSWIWDKCVCRVVYRYQIDLWGIMRLCSRVCVCVCCWCDCTVSVTPRPGLKFQAGAWGDSGAVGPQLGDVYAFFPFVNNWLEAEWLQISLVTEQTVTDIFASVENE